MSDTLFMYLSNKVSNNDPANQAAFYMPPLASVQNVSEKTGGTVFLNAAETKTITLPSYATTDWVCITARVVGEAKIVTVGTDFDGIAAIEGVSAGYGTAKHPGYISMVTKNVTSFTITGLAAGTVIEYLALRLLADNAL